MWDKGRYGVGGRGVEPPSHRSSTIRGRDAADALEIGAPITSSAIVSQLLTPETLRRLAWVDTWASNTQRVEN